MRETSDALARELGIFRNYRDGAGREVTVSDETVLALVSAFGIDGQTEAAQEEALGTLRHARAARALPMWAVVEAGVTAEIALLRQESSDWRLELENGDIREGHASGQISLGPMPTGYHWLHAGGFRMAILSAPRRLPDVNRGWGVMVPLYGLRTESQGGVGTYDDLGRAARSLAGVGAGFIGINPVHAGFPGDVTAFSPYSPSSRERFSTMHVAVAGIAYSADGALIDYSSWLPAHETALDAEFREFEEAGGARDFERWRAEEGHPLELFATHQAIAEVHGPYWTDWPGDLQRPGSVDVAAFARSHPDRVTAHAWRQWMAEGQLADAQQAAKSAGMRHGLYLDLAVGTHPAGAETWAERDLYAPGVSLGAPPDEFSQQGQTWTLAPMRPDVLAERGFEPLARILRRQLRFSGILRIDHILGFERAFWVPDGLQGSYVAMPRAAMLAVVRIEAARAGAVIVGEDLGAVPEGLRSELAASGILGCSVAIFQRNWSGGGEFVPPEHYAPLSMASFGSHDLPLWRGWRKGRDIDWRVCIGQMSAETAAAERQARQRDVAAFDSVAGTQDGSFIGLCRFIARSGAALVAVQIEDALEAEEQPNLPGTTVEHPNWRRRLTVAADKLGIAGLVRQCAEVMAWNQR